MKTEMDLLHMSDRQRQWWLKANRVTLIVVGVVWLGMIIQRVVQSEPAWFLVAMVPALALVRLLAYQYYKRKERA